MTEKSRGELLKKQKAREKWIARLQAKAAALDNREIDLERKARENFQRRFRAGEVSLLKDVFFTSKEEWERILITAMTTERIRFLAEILSAMNVESEVEALAKEYLNDPIDC